MCSAWELEVAVTADFEGCLCAVSQSVGTAAEAVLVDFTHPSVVYEHTRAAIAYGVHPVIGTTGLSPEQLDLTEFSAKASVGGAVIPNFPWAWCCYSRSRSGASMTTPS